MRLAVCLLALKGIGVNIDAFTQQDHKKWRESGRGKTKVRGYDAAYRHVRAYVLSLHPFCQLNQTDGCTGKCRGSLRPWTTPFPSALIVVAGWIPGRSDCRAASSPRLQVEVIGLPADVQPDQLTEAEITAMLAPVL